jgi:N-acetylglucosaminyldiphosphoundecaprenol N-acetyl-beta-D-mannosaminyltransferase
MADAIFQIGLSEVIYDRWQYKIDELMNDQVKGGTNSIRQDDFTREVYGVLGIPIDVVDMSMALRKIEIAALGSAPFLISTANLNFLVSSRTDAKFRESLLRSDLCTADGMPIVWIARLLGIPISERIAGADIFEALKSTQDCANSLRVFLFGGAEGAAAAACARLNAESCRVSCAGSYDPGFCSVDAMSTDAIFDKINSSKANFLAAALGAKKAQEWLLRNHDRLQIPVRVHLGATINFQAGTLKRAPASLRKFGLEWLWRIKEEPQLWRRYWGDGIVLLQLTLTRVLPLMTFALWHVLRSGRGQAPTITWAEDHKTVILSINGVVNARNLGSAISCFRDAAAAAKHIVINFTGTRLIDARFLGLLLMLSKRLKENQLRLELTGVSPRVARIFCLNGFEFLLSTNAETVS